MLKNSGMTQDTEKCRNCLRCELYWYKNMEVFHNITRYKVRQSKQLAEYACGT